MTILFTILTTIFITFLFFLVLFSGNSMIQRGRQARRQMIINEFEFPKAVNERVLKTYPFLQAHDVERVIQGLRSYFHICNSAGPKRMVSMPSQVVDVAWHEFILFTRQYEEFCLQAFGRFLHHTPAEAMTTPTQAQEGIKEVWKFACRREKISVVQPHRLPLLFALDTMLEIPDGFRYTLKCEPQGYIYCASDIGCGSGGGGYSGRGNGFDGDDWGDGDGGGDSGGNGGGGGD